MLGTILIILLILIVIGGLPHWGYWGRPGGYGYGPSLIGLLVLVLILFFLFGHRL